MWQRFTERARKVVFYAQEEAGRLGDNYVSTEHLLLGLIRENDCVACRILDRLGVSLTKIRSEVERQVTRGDGRLGQDMQLTPRAKRVIDLAYDEARQLDNNYIGTEHLLLGLIREGEGLAARVFSKLKVDLDRTRHEVASIQEGPMPDGESAAGHTKASDSKRFVEALAQKQNPAHGMDHLFLAILHYEQSIPAKALARLGITVQQVEQAMKEVEAEAADEPPS